MVDILTPHELFDKLKYREQIYLLDVRSPEEFHNNHFFCSKNIPYDEIRDSLDKLPKDKEIVAICNRGKDSQKVAKKLKDLGYNIKSLAGGYKTWNSIYDIVEVKPIRYSPYKIYQVKRLGKGCLSYIVVSHSERKAVIIDPARHEYIFCEFLRKNNLILAAVIDTHIHTDHVSGAHTLCKIYSTPYLLPKGSSVSYSYESIEDILPDILSEDTIDILKTPGHTKESVCIVLGNSYVFTGDTLFLEKVGRFDLDLTMSDGASLLYESVTEKLFVLDDNLFILPSHTQQAMVPNSSMLAASLRYVKRANDINKFKSKEAFINRLAQKNGYPTPSHYTRIKKINGNGQIPNEDLDELEFGDNCSALLMSV